MSKYRVLTGVIMAVCFLVPGLAQARVDWNSFKNRFVSEDGRVIDVRQDKTSHSEGQGYAMLLAVKHNDREAFDRIWTWTRANIGVRQGDALLAWSWGRRPTGDWEVRDYNNASDGDTLVAWALLLADRNWPEQGYLQAGKTLIESIREHLVLKKGGRLQLLPGYFGFQRDGKVILNPSYWIFEAYDCFARVDKRSFWTSLKQDALQLSSALTFGHLNLPADWAMITESGFELNEARSTHFGYEAVRIPLYMAWDNNSEALHRFDAAISTFKRLGMIPVFVDLAEDSCSLFAASGGVYAVFARACQEIGRTELSRRWWKRAEEKVQQETDDYYSHVLYLLAGLEFDG
jgi:endoglucanase